MRVIGLSWREWKTPWSSSTDGNVGTVDQLLSYLKEVLAAEKELGTCGELPCRARALADSCAALSEECPAPLIQRKAFKALGTPTVQLSACKTDLSPVELVAMAQCRRSELEAAGEVETGCATDSLTTSARDLFRTSRSWGRCSRRGGDTRTRIRAHQSAFGVKEKCFKQCAQLIRYVTM